MVETLMRTHPDGLEVVETWEGATLKTPPLLVLDGVRAFLDAHGLGSGPLSWVRVGDGKSNVTFRIKRGESEFALRRGPRPPLPKSTHDMVREARIQRLVRPYGVAVPEILAVCQDASVLGVPFYVMEWLDGVVLTDRVPDALDTPEQRKATSLALVETLAMLHSIDVTSGPLQSLGRPDGYLSRQVSRFAGLWEVNATRSLPLAEKLAHWLLDNRPTSQRPALVHGDYRLGNLMFRHEAPAATRAVLDWEMATLGDPLADLGYLTATYTEDGSEPHPLHLSPITARSGYLDSQDLAREYALATRLDLAALPWYQALALWKAAIFCEAIYTRWLHGERPDDRTFGESLEAGVPALLCAAQEYAHR